MERAAAQRAAANHKADEDAIRNAAAQYIEAAKRGDAAALAAAWTADGDYIDIAGNHAKARDFIAKSGCQPSDEGRHGREDQRRSSAPREITIHSSSLRFITPNVAIEDGISEVRTSGGEEPSPDRYTAVWVKQGDKWLLDSLREAPRRAGRPNRGTCSKRPRRSRLAGGGLDWRHGQCVV